MDEIEVDAFHNNGADVDYARLRDSQAYRRYRRELSPALRNFNPAVLTKRQEKISFWINLYNALALDAVIQLGVKSSVTEGKLGILSFFRRAAYQVYGERITLNDIEQGISRANNGFPYFPGPHFARPDRRGNWVITPLEARIHFALNCASCSCPPVQFYTPINLETQLEMATHNFINQTTRVFPHKNLIEISAIFSWYRRDFSGRQGVLDFIKRYLSAGEGRAWLAGQNGNVQIRYAPYNWERNDHTQPTAEAAGLTKFSSAA